MVSLYIGLYAQETATTPVAVNLACRLARSSLRVALVCPRRALPQGQSLGMQGITLFAEIPTVTASYDVVIINNGKAGMGQLPIHHWVCLDHPDGDGWWLSML